MCPMVLPSSATAIMGALVSWGSLGHRVDATPAPGVAAQHPAKGEKRSAARPVVFDGVHGIGRTGGQEPARRGPSGAKTLVETNNPDQGGLHDGSFRRRRGGGIGGVPGEGGGGVHWPRSREADV